MTTAILNSRLAEIEKFEKGMTAIFSNKDREAFLYRAAGTRIPEAMYEFGMFFKENGSNKDAENWLQNAADAGEIGAKYHLGVLKSDPKLIEKALEEAHVEAVKGNPTYKLFYLEHSNKRQNEVGDKLKLGKDFFADSPREIEKQEIARAKLLEFNQTTDFYADTEKKEQLKPEIIKNFEEAITDKKCDLESLGKYAKFLEESGPEHMKRAKEIRIMMEGISLKPSTSAAEAKAKLDDCIAGFRFSKEDTWYTVIESPQSTSEKPIYQVRFQAHDPAIIEKIKQRIDKHLELMDVVSDSAYISTDERTTLLLSESHLKPLLGLKKTDDNYQKFMGELHTEDYEKVKRRQNFDEMVAFADMTHNSKQKKELSKLFQYRVDSWENPQTPGLNVMKARLILFELLPPEEQKRQAVSFAKKIHPSYVASTGQCDANTLRRYAKIYEVIRDNKDDLLKDPKSKDIKLINDADDMAKRFNADADLRQKKE